MQDISNHSKENLSGVVIRCGHDCPNEYDKAGGQEVKRGVITTRLSFELMGLRRTPPISSLNAFSALFFPRRASGLNFGSYHRPKFG